MKKRLCKWQYKGQSNNNSMSRRIMICRTWWQEEGLLHKPSKIGNSNRTIIRNRIMRKRVITTRHKMNSWIMIMRSISLSSKTSNSMHRQIVVMPLSNSIRTMTPIIMMMMMISKFKFNSNRTTTIVIMSKRTKAFSR